MPPTEDPGATAVLDALREALPADCIRTGDAIGERHFSDWTRMDPQRPRALLLPRSTAEVSTMLRICHAHGQPVVPQGGLTGLVGGAHPHADEIALSLERMNAVEDVDTSAGLMTVQAGALLATAQAAAEAAGWLYGMDIGSRGSCTIGGNIATNAGGNRVIRYGMTRDLVLGLEVVLADGTVVDSMNRMIKNNTGYDLRQLFVGSEGTLGVITRAVLRLDPLPGSYQCAFLGLPGLDAAMQVLARARTGLAGTLSAFEVMWPAFHDFITRLPDIRPPLAGAHRMYLLIDAFGNDPEADATRFERLLEDLLDDGLVEDAALAQSLEDGRAFWRLRDAVAEFARILPTRSTFDVSFPLERMQPALDRVEQEVGARWPDSQRIFFGHLGDNNVHIVVGVPGSDGRFAADVDALVYGIVGEFGGSISAEHGLGRKKRAYLGVSRNPAEIALMRTVKTAFDPKGILNPGKVL